MKKTNIFFALFVVIFYGCSQEKQSVSSILNSIGLALNIIGVILLFFYGFPTHIDLSKERSAVEMHKFAKVALGLLIIGFLFQLLGTIW